MDSHRSHIETQRKKLLNSITFVELCVSFGFPLVSSWEKQYKIENCFMNNFIYFPPAKIKYEKYNYLIINNIYDYFLLNSKKEKADLVIINGKVLTIDKDNPIAEAIAVKGEKIIAVGTSSQISRMIDRRNN